MTKSPQATNQAKKGCFPITFVNSNDSIPLPITPSLNSSSSAALTNFGATQLDDLIKDKSAILENDDTEMRSSSEKVVATVFAGDEFLHNNIGGQIIEIDDEDEGNQDAKEIEDDDDDREDDNRASGGASGDDDDAAAATFTPTKKRKWTTPRIVEVESPSTSSGRDIVASPPITQVVQFRVLHAYEKDNDEEYKERKRKVEAQEDIQHAVWLYQQQTERLMALVKYEETILKDACNEKEFEEARVALKEARELLKLHLRKDLLAYL